MVTTLHLFSICLVLVGLKSLSSLVLPSRQTGHSNVAAVWQRSTHLNFAGFGKPTTAEDAVGGKKKGGFARGEVTTSPVSPSDVPDTADPCACGSGRAYGACCGRLHTAVTSLVTRTSEFEVHTAAAAALSAFSAEDVLRARYTAYKVSVVSPWPGFDPAWTTPTPFSRLFKTTSCRCALVPSASLEAIRAIFSPHHPVLPWPAPSPMHSHSIHPRVAGRLQHGVADFIIATTHPLSEDYVKFVEELPATRRRCPPPPLPIPSFPPTTTLPQLSPSHPHSWSH